MSAVIIEPVWPAPASVRSLCTTRLGGVSQPPFDSLNLADHVGDELDSVQQNRRLLAGQLELPSRPAWLDQRHGRDIVCIDAAARVDPTPLAADAAFTLLPGRACVVMTADCLPVLICDADGTRVAAVHAGWRGLALGIIEAAVAKLRPSGSDLYAWLGPAIGPQAYEIDATVRSRLLAGDPGAEGAFQVTRPGHWTADLYELARRRLIRSGVSGVFGGDFCTYGDSTRFFSYRRDGQCGRMATLIWLAG